VEPTATPLTIPPVAVATEVSDDDHVTLAVVSALLPSEYAPVAVS
jgi:hypothetical protein